MDSDTNNEIATVVGRTATPRLFITAYKVGMQSLLLFSILLFPLFFPSAVTAVEIQANANVTITPAISVSEVSPVSFGSIASGHGRCTMNKHGELSGPELLCSGEGSTGLLEIKGEADAIVSIHMRAGSESGITFTPTAFQSSGSMPLTDGVIQIPVGGYLELNSPEAGSHTIPFEVIANYE